MAGELSLKCNIQFNKGGASVARSGSVVADVTGDAFTHQIQSIGTAEELLAKSADITTPGYCYIINLDATNFVEFGVTTGVYSVRVEAGDIALFRLNGVTLYAKADTGACLIEYIIIEQ